MANTWQGPFPWHDTGTDGYDGLAPVRSFPSNGYGVYEMAGNVWEWTSDWYRGGHVRATPLRLSSAALDPRGPDMEVSFDPTIPHVRVPRKVLKGGSYLCAPVYCGRYRPAARFPQMIDTASC